MQVVLSRDWFSTWTVKPELLKSSVNLFECFLSEITDGKQPPWGRVKKVPNREDACFLEAIGGIPEYVFFSDRIRSS